jgi:hypothetical protein
MDYEIDDPVDALKAILKLLSDVGRKFAELNRHDLNLTLVMLMIEIFNYDIYKNTLNFDSVASNIYLQMPHEVYEDLEDVIHAINEKITKFYPHLKTTKSI